MTRSPTIAFVGSAGAGKSTLVKLTAQKYAIPAYLEDSEENPLLTEWFVDRKKWNYWVQLFFHSRRLSFQYQAEIQGGVLERTLFEDLIFYKLGYMDPQSPKEIRRLKAFENEIQLILKNFKKPDQTIFLEMNFETQVDRINKRNRFQESSIDASFLKNLNHEYSKMFSLQGTHPADLVIDTNQKSIEEVSQITFKYLEKSLDLKSM